jgi:hypothetical protein
MKTKKKRITILIPTCCNSKDRFTIDKCLTSVLTSSLPTGYDIDIIIRDEGSIPAYRNYQFFQIINALSKIGIRCQYIREHKSEGVVNARIKLFELLNGNPDYVLCLDDDILLMPTAIQNLCRHIKLSNYPFIQGIKIECDADRIYNNDINVGNNYLSINKETYFGDSAIILYKGEFIKEINYKLLKKMSKVSLAGEDVIISTSISSKKGRGLVAKDVISFHLSPQKERWDWETPTDMMVASLLEQSINQNILAEVFPHLYK